MKRTMKIITVIALIGCLVSAFAACTKTDTVEIEVVIPDGNPALAIASMIDGFKEYETDGHKYEIKYEIVSGAADVSAKIAAGADIAIAPTNLVAKLYNGGTKIGLIASNIYGSLYIIGNSSITALSELAGKKVVCIGQGGTPDYIMKYVFNGNNLGISSDDITYVSAGSDALALLKQNKADAAIVGEPVASMAVKNGIASILFDLQEEYGKLSQKTGYPQASTVANTDIITNHSAFLSAFLSKMTENLAYIGETDCATITQILQANGSAVTFPSADAITRSNVKLVKAADAKSDITAYLEIMGQFNSAFYGGKLPDDAFYVTVGD
jgi:NitT/TauT family transport system substrate-binding protein